MPSRDDPLLPSEPETLGPLFARHGYVFLWLHRQGTGMSSGQGTAGGDQMAHARRAKGAEGRNRVQLQLLEHDELDEATAALGKPCFLNIYPPFGADSRAGHNLIFRSVQTWESDVFAFLDEHLRQ